jgi:hypothetical protein
MGCLDCSSKLVLARRLCSRCYQNRCNRGEALPPKKKKIVTCEECGAKWKSRSGGWSRYGNQLCTSCRTRKWRKASWAEGGSLWARTLWKNFGITPKDYDDLLVKQDGRCAICRSPGNNGRRFAVDHDHDTKEVRGLLCGNCNRGLGYLQDDVSILKAALRYLQA